MTLRERLSVTSLRLPLEFVPLGVAPTPSEEAESASTPKTQHAAISIATAPEVRAARASRASDFPACPGIAA